MARRMRDQLFRAEQWEHRYDRHIFPINQYVDELRKESGCDSVPYVAPIYGGVNSKLLSLMRDPGPKTQDNSGGSGFICMENDDQTAESYCGYCEYASISAECMVPWNSYPWYINQKPSMLQLEKGITPLKRIVDLLPDLRVVMLHGVSAKESWKRLLYRFPMLEKERGLVVIKTYHTSRQAFWHKDPLVRESRKKQLLESFITAKKYLMDQDLSN